MHPDAKNSIIAMVAALAVTMGLVTLCFITWGSTYFSGVFVLTLVYFATIKIYVLH